MIRSSQIALEQEIQPDIWADVDRGLFSRLLTNLISNAYKYGKDGGHTLVSLMKEGQDIVLKVSDDGIGISEENLDKIWTRFYQVDASRTASSESEQMEGEGGVGLGLTMVKEIVHLHHGSIDVESRLGEGTIFTVRLPKPERKSPENHKGKFFQRNHRPVIPLFYAEKSAGERLISTAPNSLSKSRYKINFIKFYLLIFF